MRIRRLKLSGFKSFVEPAELRIEPGLTGVVGPNGCGKSNLLEALRWVMGEASPKLMRAGGMEDVIFAGTVRRPARDFAEVVLFADETQQADTQAYDASGNNTADGELEITRRIERGAGSAWRINGRDVRARDVTLIFADAATGAHSPALVSQGRIAAVIAARPSERRQMLEEAAGIAGLHVRRRDAEARLRAAEANLARAEDIAAGIDAQIITLRRQARAAERYHKLSARIRLAEARLLYARWRDAAAAAEEAKREAETAGANVKAEQQRASEAQATQATAAAALVEARDALMDCRTDASAHGHRMASLSGQLEAAEQRLTDLLRQREHLEADHTAADRLTRDAAEALGRLESDISLTREALYCEEERRPALALALENSERAERAAELRYVQAMAKQSGIDAEWRVADAAVVSALARLSRLDVEEARLEAQKAVLANEPHHALARAEAEAMRAQASAQLCEGADAQAAATSLCNTASSAREEASIALASARADLAASEREAGALIRDREARTAKYHGQSAITACRAAPGFERALSAVLGHDATSPLGPAPEDGDGHYWTGTDSPDPLDEALKEPLSDSLMNHVPQYPEHLAARLARTRFAESDVGRKLAPGEWLVTRKGHLRRWDGLVIRGEGAAEALQLEAVNRLVVLGAALPVQRAAQADASARLDGAQATLSEAQNDLRRIGEMIANADRRERDALRALDTAEAASARFALRRAELDHIAYELANTRATLTIEHVGACERRSALPDLEAGRAALISTRATHESQRTTLQQASAALAAHDQALAATREKVAAQAGDMRGWQARASDAARRLADMGQRFAGIDAEREKVARNPAKLIAEIEAGEAIRERLGRDLTLAEIALTKADEAEKTSVRALTEVQEVLAQARETRARASARLENEEQRRTELARIVGERFQCPPPLLPQQTGFMADDIGAVRDESAMLEQASIERERLGPVNLVAAQELADSEKRASETAGERSELTEAIHRLRGSIGNLNRQGRERLMAAFEAVDTHFQQLFTQLFEGGQAQLKLVDADDPLEAGLEIFAQPPGKRLQSLSLLSGGEQALTALALVFALFLSNPSPICVLDEVDAPLDDANIERFCDLLDVMVQKTTTRYLIVTHNAVTMSRMHRLFGVTMVEQGVSRLVSVDLGGAEQLLQ